MSDKARTTTKAKEDRKESAVPERSQVGKSPVGPIGVVLIMAYLILFSALLLYSLMQSWPTPAPTEPTPIPAEEVAPITSPVTFFRWTFEVSDEVRLLLIVALAGALGGLVHTLRSFYWYVGNRKLVRSWLPMYILLPLVGTTLGLVFYLVIRGGFFSSQATAQQTSPFGFAALASLVGLFSQQAALKLKEVAETLWFKPQPGADAQPQEKKEEEDESASGGEDDELFSEAGCGRPSPHGCERVTVKVTPIAHGFAVGARLALAPTCPVKPLLAN